MLLARLGHDVVAVDRATFPSDTLSTHSLSRSGVVQLSRWGLLGRVTASGAPAIHQVSFHVGGEVVTRMVKDNAGVDHLVAPRRYVLDEILTDAAEAAGADIRTGVIVKGVTRDARGRVDGVIGRTGDGEAVRVRARFVVGADGLHSRLASALDAPIIDERHRSGAAWYAYFSDLPWQGTELHIGDGLVAGLFPTHDGEANVWVCGPTATLRALGSGSGRDTAFVDLVQRAAPGLGERLRTARQRSPVRGSTNMPNQLRQPVGPGWALVGDAGYFRDAITGHGMSDAFRDAELLARTLDQWLRGQVCEADALARYHTTRDRMVGDLFDLTVRMSSYPPAREFVELHKRLSRAIEAEADELAAWPAVPAPAGSAAA